MPAMIAELRESRMRVVNEEYREVLSFLIVCSGRAAGFG
jgi:hypothetical protein